MAYRSFFYAFLLALVVSAGCTVVHTVPKAARAGDTIIVSMGSPDDPSLANIDLTYTPSGGSAIAIPDTAIRSIFNMYPDKTSAAWLYSSAGLIEAESGHGPWTTVMAVDLPDNGSLPVGTGVLKVNTTANYGGSIPSADGSNIALEILPGTGSPSSFNYYGFGQVVLGGDLSMLEPMKRLEFNPTFTGADATGYGAAEVIVSLDKTGIAEDDYNIIWDDKVGTIQNRNVHVTWKAGRFTTTVYFISPTGELNYVDVDFSIISTDLQDQFETGAQDVDTDVSVSVIWYDVDGNVVPGPVINKVNLTGT